MLGLFPFTVPKDVWTSSSSTYSFFLFEIHPAATLGSTVFTTMDNAPWGDEDVQGDEAAPPSSRPVLLVLLARGSHHHAKLVQVWWSHTVSPASSCAAAVAAAAATRLGMSA